ncbi:tyrosine-type recombinase/integrase [Craterilacuibacter sinensis]|uniref:Tyrosine-type recombinase/integrase n=1 Tax=Craterilacuibacter sinensis TaxID=2686017 RepID=A0A845BVZ9_9NEIS|nr:site-specific integrase [Craterilacuibacter sinensis]MXR38286.1 tyrosine-type recombinase/integrase [Craterilacuibacter sinensis]
MPSGYRVKTVTLSSGERLPVLLDREGLPMFAPTVFALTEVRGKNRAANTIGIVLRSVMAFHLFLDTRDIDFNGRIASGELLSLGEVEDLTRLCRRPLSELATLSSLSKSAASKIVSLEKIRMNAQPLPLSEVVPDVAASRLRYIRMYIEWLAMERLSRHGLAPSVASKLGDTTKFIAETINARIPNGSSRNTLGQREGVSEETVAELLRVVDPHSPDNPWRDLHTRYRNALLIHWLLYLGLRIGEVLGVRVSDIVPYHKEVTIHRRADDPADPRRYQPQTKTRARVLPISDTLLAQTQAYILNHRRALPQAKKHAFLFVASRTGQPMTLAAVGKLFKELRERCPSLPKGLSGHVLRHTWNDAFSKKMDEKGATPENERQARSYLMGWSPTSDTATVYTRRHVRNKAKEVSLDLQDQLVNRRKGDE